VSWYPIDTWIVIIGALCAGACALPGCFLVLRRMSMMGDAISHAVLPGLAIAFLVTESRASIGMFIGAAIVGVLTAVFTQWISNFGKVDRGAAMGIVFTTLFALGLILIVQAADNVDLDPGCVLYGAIEFTPLDTIGHVSLAEFTPLEMAEHASPAPMSLALPRAAVVLSVVFALNLTIVLALYKELRISSFDPALATTLGINATLMHYLLMTMVAVTTVASFEAVGSIIVIAMLIVPAATAYLLTDRLAVMLILSVALAMASSLLGHLAALTVPGLFNFDGTTTSGMMAVVAGLIFIFAWLFSPRHGLLRNLTIDTSDNQAPVQAEG